MTQNTSGTAGAGVFPQTRRSIAAEVWLVFALSLGASGVRAILSVIDDLTKKVPLHAQTTVLAGPQAQKPWLDLAVQLTSIALSIAPILLVAYFLRLAGESLRSIGLDRDHLAADGLRGSALAAVVGGTGLGLYVVAHAAGLSLTVVPESFPPSWWRIPVLLLIAAQNAALEEILVVGYLLRQLKKLGWGDNRALLVSALLRGSYHLYQGFGAFAGNVAMGLLFGRLYQRFGRTAPLVVAHTLIDAVAFVGYIVLAGHASWLPVPGR